MELLIDTNIFIDLFMNRIPFSENAAKIISLCKDKKVKGVVAAHTITNLFYILRKALPQQKRREILLGICNAFTVNAIDKEKLVSALENTDFLDFEDCLQSGCADESNVDFIITRNVKDFNGAKAKVLEPEEFLEMMEKTERRNL